jgi:hypothetical protein
MRQRQIATPDDALSAQPVDGGTSSPPAVRIVRQKDSAPKTALEGVELRAQMGQRLAQFGQLTLWTMNLKACQAYDFERLFEQSPDVLEVSKDAFSVCIALPAMGGLATEGETIIKTLWFFLRFRDELVAKALKRLQLLGWHMKVGNNRAALVLRGHCQISRLTI